MLNIIGAECVKMRKNKMFIISSLIVWGFTAFLIIIDPSLADLTDTWFVIGSPLNLVLSIMSGFVVTVLVQREYQDNTIINVLTAPVARKEFVFSKCFVWFIWHVTTLGITIAITAISYRLVYSEAFQANAISEFIVGFGTMGLLSFVTFLPLLWIAIKQRKLFYPTVFFTLVFAVLQLSIANNPIINAIPWTTVALVSLAESQSIIGTSGMIIGLTSIFVCGGLGVGLACYSFGKQDQ